MTLEELNLDIRTYNAVRRAGIETAEQLARKVETEHFTLVCGRNAARSAAQAMKNAGLIQYIRGDDVPAEMLGRELPFEELGEHIGELLALDISTESHKWYRAETIYKITDDRILFYDSYKKDYPSSLSILSYQQRHGDAIRSGGFFLIGNEAAPVEAVSAEIIADVKAAPADEDAHAKAIQLHRRIKADAQLAAESLWDMCIALKEMRDGKHYKAMLYDNFEGYCECELQMSRPQAYRYISIAENMTEENVSSMRQIGMTKLALLATVTEEHREKIAQSTDIENTTVRELKVQIDALKAQADEAKQKIVQMAVDRKELAADRQREGIRADRLARESRQKDEQINHLAAQIQELESRPVEVAVQTDETALEQLRAAHQAEIAQLKAKHREQLAKVQQSERTEQISASIRQGQFDAKHSVMQTAADDLMTFLAGMEMNGNPQTAVFIEKTKKTLRQLTNKLNDIIMEGERC